LYDLRSISITETGVSEPVGVEDFKAYAKIDFNEEDEVLATLIVTARRTLEKWLNLSLVSKTIVLDLSKERELVRKIGIVEFTLPYGPVVIDDDHPITLTDNNDNALDDDIFELTVGTETVFGAWYVPRVKISYSAGMAEVPEEIKLAIMAQTAYMYEHRGDEDQVIHICTAAKSYAAFHRKVYNDIML